MKRKRPYIIAVFGSTLPETRDLAIALGAEIVSRKYILLTGGEGRVNDNPGVKDWAIQGAMRNAPQRRAWIGIARTTQYEATEFHGYNIVLKPGFNHKRNFIEACICDAAVVLNGGDGTVSEAIFAILHRKPVISVDNTAISNPNLNNPARLDGLLNRMFVPIVEDAGSILGNYFTINSLRAELNAIAPLNVIEYNVGNLMVEIAAQNILNAVERLHSVGRYPPYAGNDQIKEDFVNWIMDI